MRSNDAFKRRVAQIANMTGQRAEQFARLLCLQIAQSVVLRSPVDTGRFRANWQYGAVTIDTGTSTGEDRTGASTIARLGQRIAGLQAGQTIFITNSLPYARKLEYGHSQQAPGGMVRLTAAEFDQFAVSAIAGARK